MRLKSSRYDLNILGYTRVTIIKTNRNKYENKSKSIKIIFFFELFYETLKYEIEIVSNYIK